MRHAIIVFMMMLWLMPAAAQSSDEVARLRVGHFSFDTQAVDVYINGELALEDFEYPDLSNWLELNPGPNQIAITPVDAPPEDAILGPVQITTDAEGWYTATVIGESVTNTARIHVLEEDFSDIPNGITRITVFNAVPDNRSLSFFTNSDRRVFGLAFPRAGSDEDGAFTINIAAQTYDLRLTRTSSESTAFFSLDDITLGSGRHYFLAAVGSGVRPSGVFVTTNLRDFASPEEVAVETEEAPDGETYLRVGHFAPGTPELTLYLNGQLTDIQGIGYAGLSEWITLPGDVYEIAFAPVGASLDEAVVVPAEASLRAEMWNTVAVVGTEGNLVSRVIAEDYTPIEEGQSRLTVFHAIPSIAALDIYLDDEMSIKNLPFPGAQPGTEDGASSVDLSAEAHDIVITEHGSTTPIIELTEVQLATGNHYFIGVVLDDANKPDYYLQVITQQAVVDDTE